MPTPLPGASRAAWSCRFFSQSGEDPSFSGVAPADGMALGDISLHGKAARSCAGYRLSLASSASLTVPTATDGQFTGTELPTAARARHRSASPIPRINLAANLGARLRQTSTLADADQGNELTYGLAAEFRVNEKISTMGELFGSGRPVRWRRARP